MLAKKNAPEVEVSEVEHPDRLLWDFPASRLAEWFNMESPMRHVFDDRFATRTTHWMRIEEQVVDGDLVIRAELPGIDPDNDVELELSDDMLHVTATRHEEYTDDATRRSEFRYGKFSRSIRLPRGASVKDVVATYKDGILMVRVPAGNPPVAQKIPVVRS